MSTDSNKLKSSKELIDLYEAMDDERKRSLCDFTDFLYAKADPLTKEVPIPEDVPRPQQETVVGAVKRLKGKYHMIESMTVFSAASALMTDHMVKGRDVIEVIDEMEILFEDAYSKLVQGDKDPESESKSTDNEIENNE